MIFVSIYLSISFFCLKQCKQSHGLYSEKNLLKELLVKNVICGNSVR